MTVNRRRSHAVLALAAAAAMLTACGTGAEVTEPTPAPSTRASQHATAIPTLDAPSETVAPSSSSAPGAAPTQTASSPSASPTASGSTGAEQTASAAPTSKPQPIRTVLPAGVVDEVEIAGVKSADGTVECLFFLYGDGACYVPAAQDGRFGYDDQGQPLWAVSVTENSPAGFSSVGYSSSTEMPLDPFNGNVQPVEKGQTLEYENFQVSGAPKGLIVRNLDDPSKTMLITEDGISPAQ